MNNYWLPLKKKVHSFFAFLYSQFFNLLAPPFCRNCKIFLKAREIFCSDCSNKLQPVVSVVLPVTKTKTVKVFAATAYKDPIKRLILAKGWSDISASVQLGELIWQRTYVSNVSFDYVLVPIPLHWTRYAKRGYNQAEEIAKTIAQKSGQPVARLLKRTRRTKFQSDCSVQERATNVAEAFEVCCKDLKRYEDKHMILVDDVMTTGATLKAAAKVIYALKPASVSALIASRTI